jgi:hypothetical protein
MKTLLIQQVYPGRGYTSLLAECFARNATYCERYDIDYQVNISEIRDPKFGGWDKVTHVQRALDSYELVVWLDADAILYDLSRDLRSVPLAPDRIGVVQFFLPVQHLNVGVLYFRNGPSVKRFVASWLEKFPGEGAWHEQAVFNQIRDETIVLLPNEWNRNYDSNPSANPVVLGFHGFGPAENRLKLMKMFLAPALEGMI